MRRVQKKDKGIFNSLIYTLNFRYVNLVAAHHTAYATNMPYSFILTCTDILHLFRTSFIFPPIISSGHTSPRKLSMTPLSASHTEMTIFLLP